MSARRDEANRLAFERFAGADPVLLDVQRAGDVLPGMKPNMVLTCGAPLPWDEYSGAHRMAIIYGALYEGLGGSVEEVDAKIRSGEIVVGSTHRHGVAGAHTGIHTARTPVFVVEDRATGARGHCSLFEGDAARRLSHGSYGDEVVERLGFVERVLAPTIGEAVRRAGGIPLLPIIERALHLGDDLHLRTVASTMLFTRALMPGFLDMIGEREEDVRKTLDFLRTAEHSFVRLVLAAAKATTESARGVEGSSLVTAMAMNCNDFAIQVSGLGDEWFRASRHPTFEGKLFHEGKQPEDAGWFGTDSIIVEVVGLGGFAGACAFSLQTLQGCSAQKIVERNLAMYDISHGEHPVIKIPYLAYRGVPIGIDLFKVVETGVAPLMNGFLTKKNGGGLVGAGVLWAPIDAFKAAAAAYRKRYGE